MAHVQDVVINEQDWRVMIAYILQNYLNGMEKNPEKTIEQRCSDAEICIDLLLPLMSPIIEIAFNGKKIDDITEQLEKAQRDIIKLKSACNQVATANMAGKDCDLNVYISKEKETSIPEHAIPYGQYEEVLESAGIDTSERKKEVPPILVPEKKELLI